MREERARETLFYCLLYEAFLSAAPIAILLIFFLTVSHSHDGYTHHQIPDNCVILASAPLYVSQQLPLPRPEYLNCTILGDLVPPEIVHIKADSGTVRGKAER